jgi:hypothetical protein
MSLTVPASSPRNLPTEKGTALVTPSLGALGDTGASVAGALDASVVTRRPVVKDAERFYGEMSGAAARVADKRVDVALHNDVRWPPLFLFSRNALRRSQRDHDRFAQAARNCDIFRGDGQRRTAIGVKPQTAKQDAADRDRARCNDGGAPRHNRF